jgi:hypothetical protein
MSYLVVLGLLTLLAVAIFTLLIFISIFNKHLLSDGFQVSWPLSALEPRKDDISTQTD